MKHIGITLLNVLAGIAALYLVVQVATRSAEHAWTPVPSWFVYAVFAVVVALICYVYLRHMWSFKLYRHIYVMVANVCVFAAFGLTWWLLPAGYPTELLALVMLAVLLGLAWLVEFFFFCVSLWLESS